MKKWFILHGDPESWVEIVRAETRDEAIKKGEKKVEVILIFELTPDNKNLANEIENAVISGVI